MSERQFETDVVGSLAATGHYTVGTVQHDDGAPGVDSAELSSPPDAPRATGGRR